MKWSKENVNSGTFNNFEWQICHQNVPRSLTFVKHHLLNIPFILELQTTPSFLKDRLQENQRYDLDLAAENAASICPCGDTFRLSHSIQCNKGGYTQMRHDDIRDTFGAGGRK